MGKSSRWASLVAGPLLVLTACASNRDAVGDFTFVSPGGRTQIFYDPPEPRGRSPKLSGEVLLEPGRQIGLSDFAGKAVVLNIWGSWCPPCRAETPQPQRVYDQTKDTGV